MVVKHRYGNKPILKAMVRKMYIVLTYKKFINLNAHNKPVIGTKNYKNKK